MEIREQGQNDENGREAEGKMSRQLLHTPEGVRDIYAEECARKMAVQDKLQNVFHLYGYQNIETPAFEFFDIFKKERGSASTREM